MKKTFRLLVAILLVLIVALGASACAVFPEKENPDRPADGFAPDGEIWVYSTKELNTVLATINEEKKIVLKASGTFDGENYLFQGEWVENNINVYGAAGYKLHIYGEEKDGKKIKVHKLSTWESCNDVTIENLEFDTGALTIHGGVNITIKNCNFTNKGFINNWLNRESAGANMKYQWKVTNLIVDGCKFDSLSSNLMPTYKGAILVRTFDTVTITNNTFSNLPWDAVNLGSKVHSEEDQRITEGHVTIKNNLFGENIAFRHIEIFAPDTSAPLYSCDVSSNIFMDNTDILKNGAANRVTIGAYVYYEARGLVVGVNKWEHGFSKYSYFGGVTARNAVYSPNAISFNTTQQQRV